MGFALGYSWEVSRIGSAKNVKRKSGAVVALEAKKSDPVRILTQFLGDTTRNCYQVAIYTLVLSN